MQMTIYPYLFEETCWVFDDKQTNLKEEAFVSGMTEMISKLVEVKAIKDAEKGFALTFSAEPFDHDVELNWISPKEVGVSPDDGNWYRGVIAGEEMTGWLCPALFCYFNEAPQKIFVKASVLPENVDPIWVVEDDDLATRFRAPD